MNRRSCVQDASFFSARAWPWQAAAPVFALQLHRASTGNMVTRMLTFCVSVCYTNGCCGYTDVSILRIRMLHKWMLWLHGC